MSFCCLVRCMTLCLSLIKKIIFKYKSNDSMEEWINNEVLLVIPANIVLPKKIQPLSGK
jgi:hypothetical protein